MDNTTLHINDLPIGILLDVASYLPKLSRGLFAVALQPPLSSIGRTRGTASYGDIVAPLGQWEELDFGSIYELHVSGALLLVSKLTEDDISSILWCIDAVNSVKRLKLTGCTAITGRCLEPLRGSTVIEVIDFFNTSETLVNTDIVEGSSLSEDVVLPILDSVIASDDCSLKYVVLPEKWRQTQSVGLVRFLERYDRHLASITPVCSVCETTIDPPFVQYEAGVWNDWENFGCQENTCDVCVGMHCLECQEDQEIDHCHTCNKSFCSGCVKMWQCQECEARACGKCFESSMRRCGECHEILCKSCCRACGECHEILCKSCCRACEECDLMNCSRGPYIVEECPECGKSMCFECRLDVCKFDWCGQGDEWEISCSGCIKLILPELSFAYREGRRIL